MSSITSQKPSQVCVVVTHVVAGPHRAVFEKKLQKLMAAASGFAGYQGSEIVQREKGGSLEYNVFYRFDTFENYCRWNDSELRAGLVEDLHRDTLSSKKHSLTGLETWFSLQADEPLIAPPKYKMAITTWVGVYSLLVILFVFFGKPLLSLSLYLRFLVISIFIVTGMTYFVMPLLTKILAPWLYPGRKS